MSFVICNPTASKPPVLHIVLVSLMMSDQPVVKLVVHVAVMIQLCQLGSAKILPLLLYLEERVKVHCHYKD